ncbi:MAG: carboxypeptidase-like regulatory domain-containing protein [Acidobacteriia bacterium]|nr:carboxypeptidase-like regulatory domain-containing protein [Terriglobia bacterium]
MSSTLKYVLLIALVLLLAAIPLAMQRNTGGIDGLITDKHGPIVKASVEARNTMSGAVFRVHSDAAGHYKLVSLPQGRYSLWVKAPEHDSEWIRELIVDQGRMTHRDIRLGISGTLPPPSGAAD